MASIVLETIYQKNGDMVLSPTELLDIYLYGVTVQATTGELFNEQTIQTYIRAAQEEVEKFLCIKLKKQLVTEKCSYFREDYLTSFPIIPTTYPVVKAYALLGMLNENQQIRYPKEWLNSSYVNEDWYARNINVVPNGSGVNADANVILTGVVNYYGLRARSTVPNYWTIQYETGWNANKIPFDLINIIGKLAAIGVFNIAGDLILGAGIASMSLGIDGLSQSISTTSSATNAGYGSRIIQYTKEVNESLKRLKNSYKDIGFTVL